MYINDMVRGFSKGGEALVFRGEDVAVRGLAGSSGRGPFKEEISDIEWIRQSLKEEPTLIGVEPYG